MNQDLISYESMMAAKSAADSAFWAMIANWVYGISALISSLITLGAVVVAYRTMNTWKHQEKIKEKKDLKVALVMYRNVLGHMPSTMMRDNPRKKELSLILDDAANKIYLPLVVMEEDINKGPLGAQINKLLNLHYDYLELGATRDDVSKYLSELLAMKIIDIR